MSADPPQSSVAPVVKDSAGFVEEFIPFVSSEGEDGPKDDKRPKSEKAKGKEPMRDAAAVDEPERDRGKPRERSRDRGDAKKRKHDAIPLDDGYMNKKQRMDAACRKAPWVYDIDWDSCKNVSEM
jgi:non-canonical poly(A) RNA polymerase PAPD5/7